MKRRALVVCAHLRPGRDKRRSRYFMQSISGLHVGSLIEQSRFDVRLHHEDWHGPFEPANCSGYDLVFLSGLQPDFDRMRQLAYYFRRAGATVVAGGSICTSFPEFATRFFDVVCVGGVDSVPQVVADYLGGTLKSIYRSPAIGISRYAVDHSLLRKSGISPRFHLMEASRGCSFKCSFCVMPTEFGGHNTYDLEILKASIDDAIASSPRLSFRRLYPMIVFLDNNFSDDRDHMLRVCEMLRKHPKIRGWSALVTQNVLHDRDLVRQLAKSKCVLLFAGLESFDLALLRRTRKTQNLSRRFNIVDDIVHAERHGIAITYGYLFDPVHQTAAEMRSQIMAIAKNPHLPLPAYLSVIAPLAGTASFWADVEAGRLAPNLRLRDLDGETIPYRTLADRPEALVEFVEAIFRRPWSVVGRFGILAKVARRVARARSWSPMRWLIIASANAHCFVWSQATPARPRSYIAGTDTLDPQYFERPHDLSDEDRERYFEPIMLTDATGEPAEWVRSCMPIRRASGHAASRALDAEQEEAPL